MSIDVKVSPAGQVRFECGHTENGVCARCASAVEKSLATLITMNDMIERDEIVPKQLRSNELSSDAEAQCMRKVYESLSFVFDTDDQIHRWLNTRRLGLAHTPVEMIRRGEYELVIRLADALAEKSP